MSYKDTLTIQAAACLDAAIVDFTRYCTQLDKRGLLIIVRADVAQCAVSSFSIVEDFDVVKQVGFGLLVSLVFLSVD